MVTIKLLVLPIKLLVFLSGSLLLLGLYLWIQWWSYFYVGETNVPGGGVGGGWCRGIFPLIGWAARAAFSLPPPVWCGGAENRPDPQTYEEGCQSSSTICNGGNSHSNASESWHGKPYPDSDHCTTMVIISNSVGLEEEVVLSRSTWRHQRSNWRLFAFQGDALLLSYTVILLQSPASPSRSNLC